MDKDLAIDWKINKENYHISSKDLNNPYFKNINFLMIQKVWATAGIKKGLKNKLITKERILAFFWKVNIPKPFVASYFIEFLIAFIF